MEAFIYALCDPCSHEIRYVGKTQTSVEKRMAQHRNDKSKTYRGKWLRGLKEKGLCPVVHVLETTEQWVEAEQFWIGYFKSLGARLANATLGGEGALGYKQTEETLAKLSAMRKGHMVSEETRKAISEKAKGNKRALGVKRSEEFKALVSQRFKGKKMAPEVIAHLSKVRKGKPWSKKQWENFDKQNGDREKNYAEINRLFASGLMQYEIAEKMKLAPGYVSKAIALHPDKEKIKKEYFANRAKRPEFYAKMNPPSKGLKQSALMKGNKPSKETRRKMAEAQNERHRRKIEGR